MMRCEITYLYNYQTSICGPLALSAYKQLGCSVESFIKMQKGLQPFCKGLRPYALRVYDSKSCASLVYRLSLR